jgi:hypothetical protein
VAAQIGWTEKRVKIYHTLSNLIPELADRWDAHEITREMAYQLAQLDPLEQGQIALAFAQGAKVPDMAKEIADYKREIATFEQPPERTPIELEIVHQEEISRLGREHEAALEKLKATIKERTEERDGWKAKLEGAQYWANSDKVHKVMGQAAYLTGIDTHDYVEQLRGLDALTDMLEGDLKIGDGVQWWLRAYNNALRARLDRPQQRPGPLSTTPFTDDLG